MAVDAPKSSRLGLALSVARYNWSLCFGGSIVAAIVIVALAAPLFERFPPETADPLSALVAPNSTHWFGTDPSGFDVWSRVVRATRVDITIASIGTAIAVGLGAVIGLTIGYFQGPLSGLISRVFDLIQSFPIFILALMLVALFGQGVRNIVFAIAFVYTPLFVRLFRAEAIRLSDRGFIRSARISGASTLRILARHILPNTLAPALGQWSTTIGWAILMAAGLSFVGAGVRPPQPEWGVMIATGASYVVTGEWWISFFPGMAISVTVLGFTLLSEGVQDALDPKRR